MKPALLVETKRNQITEKQHFGFVLVVDKKENILLKIGDDENRHFWLRSAAKPLQASLIIKSGAYDKFNLTLQELAVCCASHAGTEEHTKTVQSILNKIGLKENALQCGVHEPIDKETQDSLIRKNLEPNQLHNNCSGKHAGMLAVCVANGWNTQNYLNFDHPLQKQITRAIAEFCNFDEKNINIGRDGCSAPVHALPHYKMGVGLLNLFLDKSGLRGSNAAPLMAERAACMKSQTRNAVYGEQPSYEILKKAVLENPILAGGNERLDTEIIKASSGKLISKVAAEGLCITINLEQEQALIVKILDANTTARSITTIEALKQLKWLSEEEINLPSIKKLYDLKIRNWKNQTVGEINTCFKIYSFL
jgi:L-asparaginase II